jgi:hypothetical protein
MLKLITPVTRSTNNHCLFVMMSTPFLRLFGSTDYSEWTKVADAVIKATMSMLKPLTAFSSERGCKGGSVRVYTGLDGSASGRA